MQVSHWIQGWIIVSGYWDDDILGTKIIRFTMAKINVNNIVYKIDFDVSTDKNLLDAELLGFWDCTGLP